MATMADGFTKFVHKGKEIFYIDHASLSKDKASQKQKTIELLQFATTQFVQKPKKSVISLTNVEGMMFDMDILKVFKEEGGKIRDYEYKNAVIGVKGLLKAAYNFVVGLTSSTYRVFDTKEEALEWLVKD